MASTNKTENVNLSQFTASDKPAWLTDYNNDMQKIDAALEHKSNHITYNTNEEFTGNTWIDGKPIYRKSLTGEVKASSTTYPVGVDVDAIWLTGESYILDGNGARFTPNFYAGATHFVRTFFNNSNDFLISFGAASTPARYFLTIEYTKA